jgi:hypothetical protein
MENKTYLLTLLNTGLLVYLIFRDRKPNRPTEKVTPKDLIDQIEAIRSNLTGKISDISVGAGADTKGQGQSIEHKEKHFMGGTPNPLTLTDVSTALTGLFTDLNTTIDTETADIRGVVQNLKDQLANGTPVTQAQLQTLLDSIGTTQRNLKTKIQTVSVAAGTDTKGADDAGGGGGTPAP